jgi:hypothetical protein
MSIKPDYDAECARRIEGHANKVVNAAVDKGWLTVVAADGHQSPLQRAVNDLARTFASSTSTATVA